MLSGQPVHVHIFMIIAIPLQLANCFSLIAIIFHISLTHTTTLVPLNHGRAILS